MLIINDSVFTSNDIYREIGSNENDLGRGDNGGLPCATCTILLSITSQLAEIYNETTPQSLERLCSYLPTSYVTECKTIVDFLAPIIDKDMKQMSVDTVCYALKICYVDPGRRMCHLFERPTHPNDIMYEMLDRRQMTTLSTKELEDGLIKAFPWICYIPGVYRLCVALSDTYNKLLPGVDLDGDRHSPAETLRGSIWRGRDCADLNGEIYPGRRPLGEDKLR